MVEHELLVSMAELERQTCGIAEVCQMVGRK